MTRLICHLLKCNPKPYPAVIASIKFFFHCSLHIKSHFHNHSSQKHHSSFIQQTVSLISIPHPLFPSPTPCHCLNLTHSNILLSLLHHTVNVIMLRVLQPKIDVSVDLPGDGRVRGAITSHIPGPLKHIGYKQISKIGKAIH